MTFSNFNDFETRYLQFQKYVALNLNKNPNLIGVE